MNVMRQWMLSGGLGLSLVAMTGCATHTGRTALGGALVGAGAGALVGHAVGDSGVGALVGAGTGALLGGIIGNELDLHDRYHRGYAVPPAPCPPAYYEPYYPPHYHPPVHPRYYPSHSHFTFGYSYRYYR